MTDILVVDKLDQLLPFGIGTIMYFPSAPNSCQ